MVKVRLQEGSTGSYSVYNVRFLPDTEYEISDPRVLEAIKNEPGFTIDWDVSLLASASAGAEEVKVEEVPVQDDVVEDTVEPEPEQEPEPPTNEVDVVVETPEEAAVDSRNEFNRFDCTEDGCERVGNSGFARRTGLENHINRVHSS